MKQVLVVDDSTTARMCIRMCIKNAGYRDVTFFEATNGKEAMDIIKTNDIIPDLVVTDLNMPQMDGESLLKRIKSSPKLTDIPVVIITSAGNPALEDKLTEIGASAVINKPITPENFASILGNLSPHVEISWG